MPTISYIHNSFKRINLNVEVIDVVKCLAHVEHSSIWVRLDPYLRTKTSLADGTTSANKNRKGLLSWRSAWNKMQVLLDTTVNATIHTIHTIINTTNNNCIPRPASGPHASLPRHIATPFLPLRYPLKSHSEVPKVPH